MNLFEDSFTNKITIKSPIQYSGGKFFARRILHDFVPFGTTEVVSPFFGGGNFELYLTKRSIKVKGYDLFEPLVNFWNILLLDNSNLYNKICENIDIYEREDYQDMQRGGFEKLDNNLDRAAMFYLLQNLSFNALGFRGKTIRKFVRENNKIGFGHNTKSWGNIFNQEEIKNFYNPFIEVNLGDFRESLNKHKDLFAYCDPPYPEVRGMYGDSEDYHENFDHEALKEILDNRTADWILSYNNNDTVNSLYPSDKYDVYYPDWKQGSRSSDRGNEVLIKPR